MGKSNNEAKVKFIADTYSFTEQIGKTKKEVSNLKAQISNLDASMKLDGVTTESLTKKKELLTTELEKLENEEEFLKEKLAKSKELFGENAAETIKLKSSLEYLQRSEKNVQLSIKECDEAIEKCTSEQEEMKRTSVQLNSEIETQKNEIDKLKQKYVDVVLEQGKGSEEAKKLASEIRNLSESAAENKEKLNAAEKSAEALSKAIDDSGDSANDASNGGFTVFKGILSDLASNAIRDCVNAVKDLAKSTIETGMNFESSMSKVKALSGATEEEFASLKNSAEELGRSTQFTSSEVADGFSYMALAGWDTEEMLAGIDGVLNLAAASQMDLATASDIVTDNLSAFGLKAEDSTDLVNQMAWAMSNSNLTTEQLGESWKNCAATSTQLGYNLEDTTACLMVMADAGIKGGESGTALSSIMTRLGNNVSGCREDLESYGIEVYDSQGNVNSLSNILQGMKDVWGDLSEEQKANLAYTVAGKTAQSELMTVLGESDGNFEKYRDSLVECKDANSDLSNTAQNMTDTMTDNLKGDITEMKSAFDGLKTSIYDDGVDSMRDIVQCVTEEVIPAIKDSISWIKEHKKMIEFIGIVIVSLATGIGAYNTVMGIKAAMEAAGTTSLFGLITAQEGLNLAFLKSPITWVIAGITLLVLGFIYLWNHCEGFREFWTGLWDSITGWCSEKIEAIKEKIGAIHEKFTEIRDGIAEKTSAIKEDAAAKWGQIKGIYEENGGGLKGIAAVSMTGVKNAFKSGYDKLNTLTGGRLGDMVSTAKGKLDSFHDKFVSIKEKIKDIFNFKMKSPDIKMPKIDVVWHTEGKMAKAAQLLGLEGMPDFNITWHAKGAILTKPTIFGYANGSFQGGGEAGHEAVLPISLLSDYIENGMMKFIAAIPQIDYERFGEAVVDANSKRDTKLVINGREAGRILEEIRPTR